jgi:hypothetical protein
MRWYQRAALFLTVLVVALVYCQSGVAQEPGLGQEMVEAQRPTLTGSDPKPQDATQAILAAFDNMKSLE